MNANDRSFYRPFLCLPVLLSALISCGGGGGGGGAPANPAIRPTATASADMDGYWVCTVSELISSNTAYTAQIEVGEVVRIEAGQLMSNVTYDMSYMKVDIEVELGFPLGWYFNGLNGDNLDFHVGWDRLAQGAGMWYDFVNRGIRFAAIGPNTLAAYESGEERMTAQDPLEQWSYMLQFERTSSPSAAASAFELAMGEPFAPRSELWGAPLKVRRGH